MEVENCKNCKYWKRHKLNPPTDTPWGECNYWNEKRNEIDNCPAFILKEKMMDRNFYK